MTLAEATAIIREMATSLKRGYEPDVMGEDGELQLRSQYLWMRGGADTVNLDDEFTADQLEALAVWIRHYQKPAEEA